jgi:hypothetical protein
MGWETFLMEFPMPGIVLLGTSSLLASASLTRSRTNRRRCDALGFHRDTAGQLESQEHKSTPFRKHLLKLKNYNYNKADVSFYAYMIFPLRTVFNHRCRADLTPQA